MKINVILKIVLLGFIVGGHSHAGQVDTDWQTWYEKSNFKETPRYGETVAFCKRLADASPMVTYTTFGISPQGRDLPLLIVDKNGNATAEQVRRSNNVVFLIQAGIHSGEIDGKDAGLTLIRDMVIYGKNKDLLDHVTLLFIPIFNVDGHERFSAYNRFNQNGPEEMGWRVTAQNYNLNRDYLKGDSPEMQAWLRLYNKWLPEFFADCHVTDGADYQYAITYKIDQYGLLEKPVLDWIGQSYLTTVKPAMEESGFPLQEYISFKKAHDPKSGMSSWVTPPRLSDGYVAIQNRPGLLIETHMFKDYKTRVSATRALLLNTIKVLNRDYLKLRDLITEADEQVASEKFRSKPFTLKYKALNDSSMIDFAGYTYSKEKSSLTGGDWYRFTKDTVTWRIPFFNKYGPDIQVKLPEAYIIPVEWTEVIERIKLHGITYKILKADTKIKVGTYKFSNEKWSARPYENHHTLTFDMQEIEEERTFPKGSYIIPLSQRTAKVIANILEPKASDSFIFWGFFDSIFEVKEYVEDYVMEEYARFMLSSDAGLKKEFEAKRTADSTFAKSPKKIIRWFYERSPYWDKRINTYPVGKIFDKRVLDQITK
jgi:Zinc carboxypeptidase